MRLWAVNHRMIHNGFLQNSDRAIIVLEASKLDDNRYRFDTRGNLYFKGGQGTPFENSIGYFPAEGGWSDPYQAVTAKMTAKDFAKILKTMGFKEQKKGG